jgi:zinc-ribbon domain
MYCPNCGINNLEGARYCRSCGADISLVPQALAGHLPESQPVASVDEGRHGHRRRGGPSLDKAVRSIFMGLGFIVVAIVLGFLPMGRAWWFWMFIPAFATLGGGVAEWIRFKQAEQERLMPRASMPPAMGQARPPAMFAPAPQYTEAPRRNTAELVMPPPSVTEGTTRHLGAEAPTRHIGRSPDNPQGQSREDS